MCFAVLARRVGSGRRSDKNSGPCERPRSEAEEAAQSWPAGAATRRRRSEAHPSPLVLQLQVLDLQRQDFAARAAVSYNNRHSAHAPRHHHAARAARAAPAASPASGPSAHADTPPPTRSTGVRQPGPWCPPTGSMSSPSSLVSWQDGSDDEGGGRWLSLVSSW